MASTQHYVTSVSWYNQLKIKSKALVGISVICLLFLIGLSLSIHLVNKIHEETKEIHNKWMRSILKISEMMSQIDSLRKLETNYIISHNEEERTYLETKMNNLQKEFIENKNIYFSLTIEREEKILYEKFSSDMQEYFKIKSQIIEKLNLRKDAEVSALIEQSKLGIDRVTSDLRELIAINQQGGLESNQVADSSYYSLIFQMIVTSILTILFIYLVIYYTFKQFLLPLQLAEKATNRIAKGDWKVRIEYESRDELGNFIRTFNQMVDDHRKIDEEKTRIEKEIGRNEELFRTLIEISPDAILLIGLDFSIIWANSRMLRMFGYNSIEELRKLPAVDFTIQSERERFISIMSSLLNSDYSHYSYESEAIRKDQTIFPIEIQLAIYQHEGINVGILTNIRDIAERKLAEEALVQNEERYRIITENMADVILIIDPLSMKLIYISPSIKNLTDYSVLEIMSLHYKDILTSNSWKYAKTSFPPRIKRLLAGKKSLKGIYVDELEQFKRDNSSIWTEIVSRYIINEKTGNPEIHAVVRNITERKRIEIEMNQKSQMLGGILANMPVVVLRVNEDGVIIQSTGAGLAKMGLMENQAVNINVYEVYSEFSSEFNHAFQGEPQVFISNGLYNDGIEWFFQNYFFLDESTGGLIGFGLDISEQVLAKKAAESASKIKGEFLANISHEIRTPMNAIIGFTEILKGLITDEIQKKYLENIFSSSKTLLALISDILDLSKVESGKLELEFSPVNIQKVLVELKDIFSQKLEEKNLECQIRIDKDLPEEFIIDELRFRQIFLNLLSNAIKFTERGYVRLSAKSMKNTNDSKSNELIIIVEDTGIGIPKEEQSAIFEAFTQQRGQSHARYGGTGLGLAISNRLAQLMNGEISVESEIGKGSKFKVIFRDVKISEETSPYLAIQSDLEQLTKKMIPEEEFSKFTFDEVSIENLRPLLEEMATDLYIEWEKLSDISSINEIEEFAYKIKYLGDKFNYLPLIEYSDNLQSKALLFDMNSLLVLLKKYTKLLDDLKAIYNE